MSPKLPKPRRVVDPVYLDWVRRRRCLVSPCSAFYTDPHHLISRGSGGSDYTAIPLCRAHHSELHTIGKSRFESEHGIDLWAVSSRILGEFLVHMIDRLDEANSDIVSLRSVIRKLEDEAYNLRED